MKFTNNSAYQFEDGLVLRLLEAGLTDELTRSVGDLLQPVADGQHGERRGQVPPLGLVRHLGVEVFLQLLAVAKLNVVAIGISHESLQEIIL